MIFIDQIFLFFCILSLSFAQFLTSSDEKECEVQMPLEAFKPNRTEPSPLEYQFRILPALLG
jgi:hypothetical protein